MTMQRLPERPNLEQLKRQAKDLLHAAQAGDPGSRTRFRLLPNLAAKPETEFVALRLALHDAQSVIAREHGFGSWNALRERVEELMLAFAEAVKEFVCCATDGRSGRAQRLLALHPDIASASFQTALLLGDAARAEACLVKDPALATRRGGLRDWEPLHYVCETCLHHGAPERIEGLVTIARRLLALGANPSASHPWRDDPNVPLSALWGASCVARIPEIAELLLQAGARPNDGESVYHAAEHGDIPMLELLHRYGANADDDPDNRWGNTPLYFVLGHAGDGRSAAAIRAGAHWLLEHGANPNRVCGADGETPVHAAAKTWDGAMLQKLARHGADFRLPRKDGRSPFNLAAVNGNEDAVAWLRAHGLESELTEPERFLAACMRGDRSTAQAQLEGSPGLRGLLAAHPAAASHLHEVARRGNVAALETMLACGFDVRAVDGMGATALHWAAWTGCLPAVRLLLASGAPLDAHDNNYNALPLGWADHGSIHAPHPRGDYPGVVLALLQAGSPLHPDEAAYGDAVHEALAEFRRNAPGLNRS
jgi:ankyrin repeat protein